METVMVALVAGLTLAATVFSLGRTIAKLAEHNTRLTHDALRMMQSKGYQDFAVSKRIEVHADALRDGPRGPNPDSDERTQKARERDEWEQAFDSPHSQIENDGG